MTNLDTRTVNRDSLFLLANVRLRESGDARQLKMRNLSAGGAMAEGKMAVARGAEIEVELRNLGWVPGVVAWTQDDRFGISFLQPIDPALARSQPAHSGPNASGVIARRPVWTDISRDPGKVRAI